MSAPDTAAGLRILGAAGTVTGSSYLVEAAGTRILCEFGMYQGSVGAELENRRIPPIDFDRLDAVVVTHAHLDHVGRTPLLPRLGYEGPIWTTHASFELAKIILMDAARLQEEDFERHNRRRVRRGRPPLSPLYETADVLDVLPRFRTVAYGEAIQVGEIEIRWYDAGHILGSALLEFRLPVGEREARIVFSGDLGPQEQPLLPPPTPPPPAELVVMESTYGDRDHRDYAATIAELVEIVTTAAETGGKVLIPAFAVGRTQWLLYELRRLYDEGRLPRLPVYLDSPMAIAATRIYRRHRELYDLEARALLAAGRTPLDFPELRLARTTDDSRAINDLPGAAIVIAGSGMATGGRILHHFRHQLWRPETHVVFVGFQARGTLGRALVEGARQVRIGYERIAVKARIHTLGGFSAHAGASELEAWARHLPNDSRIVLTHGEEPARQALARRLGRAGYTVLTPRRGEHLPL